MPGFKRFRRAATTISGIELTHRIRKGQFDLAKPGLEGAVAPTVWNDVLFDRDVWLAIRISFRYRFAAARTVRLFG
jgi:hypothetical protein